MRKAAFLALCVLFTTAPSPRTTASSFYMEVQGQPYALASSSGGALEASVSSATGGRVSGRVTVSPLLVELSPGAIEGQLEDWIEKSVKGERRQENVELLLDDGSGSAGLRRTFQGASISKVVFPALNGSSKDPGYIGIEIQPTSASGYEKAGGGAKASGGKSKKWQLSQFRVEVDGLPTNRVRKVSELTWSRVSAATSTGANRTRQAVQGQVSNLTLTIAIQDFDQWNDWFKQLVLEGRSDRTKSASIELLQANGNDKLATLDLKDVGIISLEPVVGSSGSGITKFEAKLSVNSLNVNFN